MQIFGRQLGIDNFWLVFQVDDEARGIQRQRGKRLATVRNQLAIGRGNGIAVRVVGGVAQVKGQGIGLGRR